MNTSTPRTARLLKDRKPYQEWVDSICKELEDQTNRILELETENASLEEQVQRSWQQNASLARERRIADARREDAEEQLRRALAECERLRGLLDLSSDTDSDVDTQYDSAVESKQDSIPSPERKASPSPIKARTVLPSPPQSQARPPQPSVSTPSPVKTSSGLPSPPASQARPTVSPRSDNIFADFTFYFAEAVPRPVHTCIGPFDLETLGPALGLDSDMRRVVQGLSTACDLEARICNSADLIFFYHPVFVELGLGGESKGTYFVDWGQASVNSRLEDRMLARQETPSHVFVQYPGVKERWFYYGAHPLAVMNSETCNFWSQVLEDGPSKDDILKHLGTRSKMGGVDIGQLIDTDHLVQISFEMGEEDVKATKEMKQRLKRAR